MWADESRIRKIRQAEAQSHIQVYSKYELFASGSWLSKPVKTVLDLFPYFHNYRQIRILDLGSGVGRNSIPAAQYFHNIPCQIDCVDILDAAIRKLNENAQSYGVAESIRGILSPIDTYDVEENCYDLILAVSALEHTESRDIFLKKLTEIRQGLRPGGIVCFIINTGILETDKCSGRPLQPQFEVNFQTEELHSLLSQVFSGWLVLKHTVVHQKYDIPRDTGIAALETDVITYAVRQPCR